MALRDLTVDIDFGEVDISRLSAVDNAINEIENSLQNMGGDITTTAADFQLLGGSASGIMEQLADQTRQTERAVEELDRARVDIDGLTATIAGMQAMELASSIALANMQRDIDAVTDELQQLQAAQVATGASSGIMAAMFNTSMGSMGMSMLMFGGKVGIVAALVVAAFGAMVAAGAPLLMLLGGLTASLAAATLAGGAVAAVAVPAFMKLTEGIEGVTAAQEKLAAADTTKERLAAEKELAAVWEGMSESQHDATHALMQFKEFFGEFAAEFEKPVFDIFTSGLQFVESILVALGPTITNTLAVIGEMMTSLNSTVAEGGFKEFFDWLGTNGAESLRSFAQIGGNLLAGFFEIFQAFAPIGASIEESLISLTERFFAWSAALGESNGFNTFIEYAKVNTPIVIEFLKSAWGSITALVEAFAPMGTSVLQGLTVVFDKLAEYAPKFGEVADAAVNFVTQVSDNWPLIEDALVAGGAAVVVFVGIMKTMSIISTVTTLFAAWRAGTLLQTGAMLGLNLAMLANPVMWVVAAIAALIAIGILLYRNWDTVKTKAGELWAKLMDNPILALIGGPLGALVAIGIVIYKNFDTMKARAGAFFEGLMGWVSVAKGAWENLKESLSNFKMPSIKIPGAGMLAKVGGYLNGSHANGLARVPFDGYTAELHKDEAVLTADQANQMRRNGMLGATGDRPSMDIGKPTGGGAGAASASFAPVVNVTVNGNGDAQDIKQQVSSAIEEQMAKFWRKMDLQLEG